MKKTLKALLYSLLIGGATYLLALIPLIMIKMTGQKGGPAWVDTAFGVVVALVVFLSFVFIYRRQP